MHSHILCGSSAAPPVFISAAAAAAVKPSLQVEVGHKAQRSLARTLSTLYPHFYVGQCVILARPAFSRTSLLYFQTLIIALVAAKSAFLVWLDQKFNGVSITSEQVSSFFALESCLVSKLKYSSRMYDM